MHKLENILVWEKSLFLAERIYQVSKEFIHFLGIANGSSYEVLTQIILSNKLKYIHDAEKEEMEQLINEIQKMLFGFRKQLSNNLVSHV